MQVIYPIINQGIVEFTSGDHKGQKFVFRSFINQPLGWAYLYPYDKPGNVVEMEMQLLADGDRETPVLFPNLGRAFPVFWDEEGMPQMAVADLNVFVGVITGDLKLVEHEEKYWEDHVAMMGVFKKYYDEAAKSGDGAKY